MELVVCCVCTKEILKSVRRKFGGCNGDMHGTSCGDEQMVGTLKKDKTEKSQVH
jgi:cobalamin synthase